MPWAKHWDRAKTWFLIAWALAVIPNAADPTGQLDGPLWNVLRVSVSTLWVAACVHWLLALVQHKVRHRRASRPPLTAIRRSSGRTRGALANPALFLMSGGAQVPLPRRTRSRSRPTTAPAHMASDSQTGGAVGPGTKAS